MSPTSAFLDFFDPFGLFTEGEEQQQQQKQEPVTERQKKTSENLDKSEITTGEFNSSFLIVGEWKLKICCLTPARGQKIGYKNIRALRGTVIWMVQYCPKNCCSVKTKKIEKIKSRESFWIYQLISTAPAHFSNIWARLHTVSFDWFLSGLEWIGVLLTKTFDILSEIIMEYQI